MVIPPMRGLSAESEKKNQLCVLGASSVATQSGMQARTVNPCLKTKELISKSIDIFLREDFFHPSDDAVCQANLDSVRMGGRFCENILDDTPGQFAGALILFLDNLDQGSRFNINPAFNTHFRPLPRNSPLIERKTLN
jgi:hypothetical protein